MEFFTLGRTLGLVAIVAITLMAALLVKRLETRTAAAPEADLGTGTCAAEERSPSSETLSRPIRQSPSTSSKKRRRKR